MKKSVYSLVLMDEVIEKIDEMAYSLGTSRSNLINQILAEKVSCLTPQKRNNEVFLYIKQEITAPFIIAEVSSSAISARRALKYKYNPTVKYSVEIFPEINENESIGAVHVTLRTKNSDLIAILESYYDIIEYLEKKYKGLLDETFERDGGGNFSRYIGYIRGETTKDLSSRIINYVKSFDMMLQYYVRNFSDEEAVSKIESFYIENN